MAEPRPIEHGIVRAAFTQRYAVWRPAHEVRARVLALHGWGQIYDAFLAALAPVVEAGACVIAPQAPHPFNAGAGKKVGFSWLTAYERDQAVADVNAYLAQVLAALSNEGGEEPPLFLLGYSQGVSVAWRFALSGLPKPAGLVACSADLAPDVAERLDRVRPMPVLLVHGEQDVIAPIAVAHAARGALLRHHFACDTHFHAGGHRLTPGAVRAAAAWLAARC